MEGTSAHERRRTTVKHKKGSEESRNVLECRLFVAVKPLCVWAELRWSSQLDSFHLNNTLSAQLPHGRQSRKKTPTRLPPCRAPSGALPCVSSRWRVSSALWLVNVLSKTGTRNFHVFTRTVILTPAAKTPSLPPCASGAPRCPGTSSPCAPEWPCLRLKWGSIIQSLRSSSHMDPHRLA